MRMTPSLRGPENGKSGTSSPTSNELAASRLPAMRRHRIQTRLHPRQRRRRDVKQRVVHQIALATERGYAIDVDFSVFIVVS